MEVLKKDIYNNTVIIGDFNTPLSTMDRCTKQRINDDIMALSDTLVRGVQPTAHRLHLAQDDYKCSQTKKSRSTVALNEILDQMDLTDIYTVFHPRKAKYTFFSNAHGSFSKTDHMVGHKTSLNKFKKIVIISSIFLDHNGLKLENNLKEKDSKTFTYMETE